MLTLMPGNYVLRFSDVGALVRELGEWRAVFYTAFRRRSREHSGLSWRSLLEKVVQHV